MKSLTDRIVLASSSHFPLSQIIINSDYINDWDAVCSQKKIKYSILRGYYGSENGNGLMMIGFKKEDAKIVTEIIGLLKEFGYSDIRLKK